MPRHLSLAPSAQLRRLSYLFVQLNRGCNLKCTHCDYWKLREIPDALGDDALSNVIAEFAELSEGRGTVVSCGGESMLALDRYYHVAERARNLGLGFFSVTNGSLIKSASFAERVVTEGPTEITVSMDAPDAATHDRLRGAPGSFEVTRRAIHRLIEARRMTASPVKIHVMALVSQAIVGKLDAFYDLVLRELCADKLKLNLLQPTFGHGGSAGPDVFFSTEMIRDVPRFIDEVRATDSKWGISRNPEWLRQVEMYLNSIGSGQRALGGWAAHRRTTEHICNTYERNVMLDIHGTMRLCFSTAFPGVKWSAPGDLRDFWSGGSRRIAERMARCNRYCGISHSVRRESATLPSESTTPPTTSFSLTDPPLLGDPGTDTLALVRRGPR